MISEELIQSAKNRIASQIINQCIYGKQTSTLPISVAACGQFFNSIEREQRGAHGTAAALRVVAEHDDMVAGHLIPRLVTYLRDRRTIEAQQHNDAETLSDINADDSNVIKLSETLYSVAFIRSAQYSDGVHFANTLANKLLKGYIQNKGWPHFLGSGTEIDPLPTAFAVLALCRNGYENKITGAIEYIKDLVCKPIESQPCNFTDSSVQILCIYALISRKPNIDHTERKLLEQALKRQWKTHEALMHQDIEQNIEYWRESVHYYVRIPWQLYIISSATLISPRLLFSTAAQNLINRILKEVHSNGFRYPHSGSHISTRTNAIVYDMLNTITQHPMTYMLGGIMLRWDQLRTSLGGTYVRIASFLAALAGILVLSISWYMNDRGKTVASLGPNLVASGLCWLLGYLMERLKK